MVHSDTMLLEMQHDKVAAAASMGWPEGALEDANRLRGLLPRNNLARFVLLDNMLPVPLFVSLTMYITKWDGTV